MSEKNSKTFNLFNQRVNEFRRVVKKLLKLQKDRVNLNDYLDFE
ncbi:hypothetical protein DFR28_10198 [Arenicella xantha]|uniref:Uncharacterized protein n=1 Tax=Arenicella xantha TaxID=644221 RepID=A0A395JQJ7_9GAMM|nr:hypothetical protein DFR28_10198 [Arenicella xantha]